MSPNAALVAPLRSQRQQLLQSRRLLLLRLRRP
jgi:hypothetical protein